MNKSNDFQERHAASLNRLNKPEYLLMDSPDNIIVVNGHEIAFTSANMLGLNSGTLAVCFFNVEPANVRVIIHFDKLVIEREDGHDGRMYLNIDVPAEAHIAAEYFKRHGFNVESHL